MANTPVATPIVQDDLSISQLDMREVSDEIRYLGYGSAKISVLIENALYKDGKREKSPALIGKRSLKTGNPRFEMYTRSPRADTVTVTSGTEITSSGFAVSSVAGVPIEALLYNPRNNTRARIETITTLTIKGSSVGATTFSCQAGDVLMILATATDEVSDTSHVINGTDDQNYNTLQISRWSVSISWLKEKIKQHAGGPRLSREKQHLLWESMEAMERNWIFSEMTADKATKNTTTGIQTGFTGEFMTNDGLVSLAANSVNANNAGDLSWIRQNLPLSMGDQMNDDDTYIALCSNEYHGRLVDEMDAKLSLDKSGELDKFGITAYDIVTAGPKISLVKHKAFNQEALKDKMLVMAPRNLGYVYQQDHDLQPNNGIQDNKAFFTQDEIYAFHGIETKDAGNTLTWVTDLF